MYPWVVDSGAKNVRSSTGVDWGCSVTRKVLVEGFVTTSAAVEKYDGVVISPSTLENVARDFLQIEYMNLEHDSRERIEIRVLAAEVRRTETSIPGVWVMYGVDEDEWQRVGGRLGFSISVIQTILHPDPSSEKPAVLIAFEAGCFPASSVDAAVAALHPRTNLSVGLLYQFTEEAQRAKVVIEFVVTTLQSLGVNVLYDALKAVLVKQPTEPPAAPTVFDFKMKEKVSKGKRHRTVTARLETDDTELLREAVAGLTAALSRGGDVLSFDNEERGWKKLG